MADDSKATDVGERYALALFDLAKDEKRIPAVEADLKSIKAMLAASADLRTLLGSPKFNAEAKGKGLTAVAAKAKFNSTTQKFLGLLAANGRAGLLASVITSFEALTGMDPEQEATTEILQRGADKLQLQMAALIRKHRPRARTSQLRYIDHQGWW